MDVYILKFTACLAILVVFYKLFLENQNMHRFKRYYLLLALVFAFSIPFVTFTEYIEPSYTASTYQPSFESTVYYETTEVPKTNYLPIVLWSIYGLGVFLFLTKFILNLTHIFNKIRKNETQSTTSFIYVLLKDLAIPHSFFSYIFLNKQAFKSEQIPKEVLIHEQTHAQQKHSVDILIMELLQIIFWFHPLIYVMKHSIKLNHEFLADEAVIHQGIEASTYQKLLLAFSSNASKHLSTEIGITSSINYSSIKKRFTVMKTQTSKTRMWLSTLGLIHIIAILFYNFSSTEYILKESPENIETLQEDKILNVVVNSEDEIIVNGVLKNYESFESFLKKLSNTELYKVNFKTNMYTPTNIKTLKLLLSYNLKIPYDNNLSTEGLTISDTSTIKKRKLTNINGKEVFVIEGGDWSDIENYMINIQQQKATPEEVEKYNQVAKRINSTPKDNSIIKLVDLENMLLIYQRMSDEQKEKAEPFPQLNIYEAEEPKMNLRLNGTNVQQKDTISIILYPLLEIKEDHSLWLNGKQTSFETIKEDFNNIVKNKKSKLNLKSTEPVSHQFINEILEALGDNIISINHGLRDAQVYDQDYQSKIQQKATEEEISEYNKLTKHCNNQLKSDAPIIKVKDIKRIEFLYGKMTDEQKKNAEPYPDFSKITPPPAPADPPAPPKPKSAYEFVKSLKNDDITYYFNEEKVSYEDILKITKANPKISVHSNIENNKGYVKFWIQD
jgi:biopolymer transport protein ExbD